MGREANIRRSIKVEIIEFVGLVEVTKPNSKDFVDWVSLCSTRAYFKGIRKTTTNPNRKHNYQKNNEVFSIKI
ncbi:hypothetical protein CYANOKiyG1_00960 [Okeania sp. KiyG1]|nr:hypothetical protein CYANOKiyG1_00960 [Okeania sp. KiyG1]